MTDEALDPGTLVVGRYQVVRSLGEGSVKRVFLAYDRLAQRQVALCLLRGEFGPDTHIGARFSREGRAAAALLSPYVVRVFDVGKTALGTRYLATEAVLGRGLDEALAYGAVPARIAVLWAAQVLAGLEEAHRRGVVHRDVKPENVMLASGDGVIETAKLTDFGLAKLADPSLEGSIHLRTTQG
ncbi:MAG: serine/threonine-protein kinase, partial [Polyangiales bacterium]